MKSRFHRFNLRLNMDDPLERKIVEDVKAHKEKEHESENRYLLRMIKSCYQKPKVSTEALLSEAIRTVIREEVANYFSKNPTESPPVQIHSNIERKSIDAHESQILSELTAMGF